MRVEESGSDDEEEFEDSKEDWSSYSRGVILKGVLIKKNLSRMLSSIKMWLWTTTTYMKLYMLSKLSFKVRTALRHH